MNTTPGENCNYGYQPFEPQAESSVVYMEYTKGVIVPYHPTGSLFTQYLRNRLENLSEFFDTIATRFLFASQQNQDLRKPHICAVILLDFSFG